VTIAAQSLLRAVRTLALVLAIFATLSVSIASTSHIDSSPNGCNICFVAHTVAFETPSAQPFCGPEMVGRATLVTLVIGYQACASQPSCSRGPPPAFASLAY
jgi:hypothetical protein